MSDQAKHTPGPWRYIHRSTGISIRDDSCDPDIAFIKDEPQEGRHTAQAVANARLLGEAPEMLRQLQHAAAWMDEIMEIDASEIPPALMRQWQEFCNHYDSLNAAIAKARGES